MPPASLCLAAARSVQLTDRLRHGRAT